MDRLNKNQKIAVWIAIAVATVMLIGVGDSFDVDYARLLFQDGLLGLITWAAVTNLKSKS